MIRPRSRNSFESGLLDPLGRPTLVINDQPLELPVYVREEVDVIITRAAIILCNMSTWANDDATVNCPGRKTNNAIMDLGQGTILKDLYLGQAAAGAEDMLVDARLADIAFVAVAIEVG